MRIQELFGISLPIIQAPMAGAQGSALAIAVSQAGALGSLPCAMLSEESIRQEVATFRDQTDRPLNLNFFCHTQPEEDAEQEQRWRNVLSRYYVEFGIDPASIGPASRRNPFDENSCRLVE